MRQHDCDVCQGHVTDVVWISCDVCDYSGGNVFRCLECNRMCCPGCMENHRCVPSRPDPREVERSRKE
jgi:hypothetical protein